MIPTRELLYDLRSRMNKVASNDHQDIQDEDLIAILRTAQISLVKKKIGYNNLYKQGLDSFKKRYADLQGLIEPYNNHALDLLKTDNNLHRYTYELGKLKPQFMMFIDAYAKGTKNSCKDKLLYLDRSPLRHDSISSLLDSTIYKPSFEWRRILADITDSELGFYTDGTFTIDQVYVSYLRYPVEMDIEGYIDLNGNESKDVDCELEYYLKDELLDIAELNLGMNTNNVSSVQNAQQRLSSNE